MTKSNTDNFENIADAPDIQIGMSDSNRTSPMEIAGGGPFNGKDVPQYGAFKKTQTDISGPSGFATMQYSKNETGINSSGSEYHPNRIDGVSLPVAQGIDPLTFGDPNDTSLDFKDGKNQNTVTIRGGDVGDITNHGFSKPSMDA